MITKPAILERVIQASGDRFSEELAHQILDMHFPPEDQGRYGVLAEKVQEGSLTAQEQAELDDYVNINTFLMMLQSKARMSLKAS